MKNFRFLLLLLCLCMLLPVAACESNENNNDITNNKYYYDDSCRERAEDHIPFGYNLENQTITFFTRDSNDKQIVGDGESTDIIYSRIHERNRTVEERLNVDLAFTSTSTDDMVADMKKEISTMSTAWEVVIVPSSHTVGQKLFNYFHNLNDSKYIDIHERWWQEDSIMELSMDNINYRFLFGDIHISNTHRAGCIFYNKTLYEQYISPNKDRNDIYQTVLDGNWTLEELDRLVRKSHIERGGDGSNDIYGLIKLNSALVHFMREAADIRTYERNNYGMPVFNFKNDRSVSFLTQLNKLMYENPGTNINKEAGDSNIDFESGNLVFETAALYTVLQAGMREMRDDFGILPYPKFDTDQEEYITMVHNASFAVSIPVSTDINRAEEEISAVIEALASESYRNVSVSFYETALKAAYNRDDQSAQMIDIITGQHDTVKSKVLRNFAFEYDKSLSGISNIFYSLMKEKSNDFVSKYDSIIGSAKSGLNDLIKQYKEGNI
ncbi:MAG: hypothetical protein IJD67_02965 [Clostridia bacterium]|nr:hypothetical protein [Clostridia bacterium]